MLDNYSDIRTQLGGSGASAAVAEAMIMELQNQYLLSPKIIEPIRIIVDPYSIAVR